MTEILQLQAGFHHPPVIPLLFWPLRRRDSVSKGGPIIVRRTKPLGVALPPPPGLTGRLGYLSPVSRAPDHHCLPEVLAWSYGVARAPDSMFEQTVQDSRLIVNSQPVHNGCTGLVQSDDAHLRAFALEPQDHLVEGTNGS